MPLFPVLVPSLPSFPSFPSVSSMRALLDPEPQLFYPAPKSPSHRRGRRDSASSTRSSASVGGASGRVVSGSPVRRPLGSRAGQGGAGGMGLGRLGGASRSAVDLSGWGEVDNPLAELGRRNSLSVKPFYLDTAPSTPPRPVRELPTIQLAVDTSPSPSRPSHRRSQSALPTPGYTRPFSQHPAPRGRLVEFCRNPLASSSAVSLPTLAEGEMEHLQSPYPPPPAPDATPTAQTRLHRRPSRTATIVIPSSPSSPTSLGSSGGSFPSPLSLSFSLDSSHSSSSDYLDYFEPQPPVSEEDGGTEETPRPAKRQYSDPTAASSSVPPPQRVARLRPPPSPRSYSEQPLPGQRSRTQSYGPGMSMPLSSSTAVSTVSDVAVKATWAFPSSPERQDRPAGQDGGMESRAGSGRLRDRLRTLSMLDTSPTISEPDPDRGGGGNIPNLTASPAEIDSSASVRSFQFPITRAATQTHQSPNMSHLQRSGHHRHTHSSPNSLPPPRPPQPQLGSNPRGGLLYPDLPPLHPLRGQSGRDISPGRPGHRRTTTPSRLRSPQLLSMPLEHDLMGSNGVGSQGPSRFRTGADGQLSSNGPHDVRGESEARARKISRTTMASLPLPQPQLHPLARTRSAVDRHLNEGGQKAKGWWRMRRYSVSGELSPRLEGAGKGEPEVRLALDGDDDDGRKVRGNSPEDERFIDFDDI